MYESIEERPELKKRRDPTGDRTVQIDKTLVVDRVKDTVDDQNRRACFIIMGGLDVGSEYFIDKRRIILGRDPDCDLVLRDDGISRKHAEVLRVSFDQLLVRDLESTNGTFVNGVQVREAEIREGGKVLLGRRTVIKFVLQDQLEQNYQRKLYESSTRDGLTGVYNRKYFSQKIVGDLSFARRHRLPFSLLMIDIDHFKAVNDTFGHRTGDHVLSLVTEAMQQTIRTEDVLARFGGEEFVISAPGTDYPGAHALAERVRRKIEEQVVTSVDGTQKSFSITVSIGTVTAPGMVLVSSDELIAVADKNLYRAKESGRNQVISSEIKPRR